MAELISMAEMAMRDGVSREAVRQTVERLVSAGMLEVIMRGRERLIDPAEYRAAKELAGDPSRKLVDSLKEPDAEDAADDAATDAEDDGDRDREPSAAESYSVARAEEQLFRTAPVKLKYRFEVGELTEKKFADEETDIIFRTLHERIICVINNIAEEAQGLKDRRDGIVTLTLGRVQTSAVACRDGQHLL